MCLGIILDFLLSLAAFPANSNISAVKYSKTEARYTGAPAPTHNCKNINQYISMYLKVLQQKQ